MSLVRLAHRLTVVRALRGATLAGDRVIDSSILSVEVAAKDHPKPFVVVYTDDLHRRQRGLDPGRRDDLSIVLEIGGTSTMVNDEAWSIPPTDAGLELSLDLIERQIAVALADEGNAWSELWRRLHTGDPGWKSMRGSTDEGIRLAGRRITIDVDPIGEPAFGRPPTGVWADFLTLLATDPTAGGIVDDLRGLFVGSTVATDAEAMLRRFGLYAAETAALLLGGDHETTIGGVTASTEPVR
jgi:hypothetical protein